jgi:hypothetical protein
MYPLGQYLSPHLLIKSVIIVIYIRRNCGGAAIFDIRISGNFEMVCNSLMYSSLKEEEQDTSHICLPQK